jgi:hypothetical protein
MIGYLYPKGTIAERPKTNICFRKADIFNPTLNFCAVNI